MSRKTDALSMARTMEPRTYPTWKTVLCKVAHVTENAVDIFCKAVVVITGLALLVVLTGNVILRYGFGVGIDAAAEVSTLLFPVFVMAGVAQAALQGAHVATQILMNALNDKWRLWLTLLIHSVTAWVYLYLSWYAFQNAIIAHDELSTILNVPGSVGYGSLSVGLALVGLCSLAAIVRHTVGGEKVTVNLADSGPGVV